MNPPPQKSNMYCMGTPVCSSTEEEKNTYSGQNQVQIFKTVIRVVGLLGPMVWLAHGIPRTEEGGKPMKSYLICKIKKALYLVSRNLTQITKNRVKNPPDLMQPTHPERLQ